MSGKYEDAFGHVSVRVEVGRSSTNGTGSADTRYAGWNHTPEVVAAELRRLADEIDGGRK